MKQGSKLNKTLKLAEFSFADGGGGAAKAAYRLHTALEKEGVDTSLVVLKKLTEDPSVKSIAAQSRWRALASDLAPRLDQLPLVLLGSKTHFYSTGWYGVTDPVDLQDVRNADVICLYWTTRGLLSIKQIGRLLRTGKPIVWRLSDMWPFTGGCHYSGDCTRFISGCGMCPQLGSSMSFDLSSHLHRSKIKHWSQGSLTIVAPSRWMAEKAKQSKLFADRTVEVIATGVDCTLFRPLNRSMARNFLQLPQDKALVLLGATSLLSDPRKGGTILPHLVSDGIGAGEETPGIVLFGTSQRPDGIPERIPVYPLGVIRDEIMLPLIYSACDVFVAPSREENLANTVLEAMACGLPIVSYRVGGMTDAVEHNLNGLLYESDDQSGLANGLANLLRDPQRMTLMSTSSRERSLRRFSLDRQAQQYKSLFMSLVHPHRFQEH